ncbi:ImmA/IrrE family metallo-endopeptidase [Sellimonas catena]|uniref:IrrE N-terminal-like domain-containing protein n=1 Tax=Sellimonas catena TaxID=2994035 RepID=A0A9W6C3K1_9FIRM|nr:ImmA/IrrE family metallo-endopeptidase [Sellimonas catena]GLG03951.1 hypothetical protein Selli1_11250 [Sellimonas catena]
MNYNINSLIPYIPTNEYDAVAEEFLHLYCEEALLRPMAIPIEHIAKNELGLDVKYIRLSEECDIYGMTIFSDGIVEVYDPAECLYDSKIFKRKTILIDPEAVKKTNLGCRNNTLAHECVHWYKHRLYYKMQSYTSTRQAKYCKCRVENLPNITEDENIMEAQARGIAPRILMPRATFIEAADQVGIKCKNENRDAIARLAKMFNVSRQSVRIRLNECGLL